MRFEDFQEKARRAFEEIPGAYREGIDGLTISGDAPRHPTLADVYTLGECLTESYPSDWAGPDTTRSIVVLYHGSFRALAALDDTFDWEEQIWETLTHELRHHLESLVDEDALGGVDYALDEGFRRSEGLDFDPWYYQHGDRLDGGAYDVEGQVFLEQVWARDAFDAADVVRFRWLGEDWVVPRPEALGDVHYVSVDGLPDPRPLQLVLVRKRSWRENVKGFLGRADPDDMELWESAARARLAS